MAKDNVVAGVVLAGVVAVAGISLAVSNINERWRENELKTAATAAAAKERTDWAENKATILNAIDIDLAAGRITQARDTINKYDRYGDAELNARRNRMRTLQLRADLAGTPKDKTISREGIMEQLVALNPADAELKRALATARRERIAYLAHEKAQQRADEAADRARRRRQGVAVGMSQNDVLLSSWGRPDHINRSEYSWGNTEQWVYSTGNYLYFRNGVLSAIQTSR